MKTHNFPTFLVPGYLAEILHYARWTIDIFFYFSSGYEPWAVEMPLKDCMVVGYDSYHDSNQKGMSVGAFVSTTNQTMTRYHSTCTMHRNDEELLNQMRACVTNALRK